MNSTTEERATINLSDMEVIPSVHFTVNASDLPTLESFRDEIERIYVTFFFSEADEELKKVAENRCSMYISLDKINYQFVFGRTINISDYSSIEQCAVAAFADEMIGSQLALTVSELLYGDDCEEDKEPCFTPAENSQQKFLGTLEKEDYIAELFDDGESYNAYISERDCGFKSFMFGLPKEQQSFEQALEIFKLNFDQYVECYEDEMDILEAEFCKRYDKPKQ